MASVVRRILAGVRRLLTTNDDGVDSPALVPLCRALSSLGSLEVVVPDRERSWIAKAITRHEEIVVESTERGGIPMYTTTGYPADCTQLGVYSLFEGPPELVVSGINIGFNHGLAYTLSSGTVGAAVEAWISGVPAIAISAGTNGDWPTWAAYAQSPDSAPMWERLAAVAADIVGSILEHGFPGDVDVISVNMPDGADASTPRRAAEIARVGYERLFAERSPGRYAHEYGGGIVHYAGLEGTDIEVTRRGEIAITPISLAQSAELPGSLRDLLEG